MMNKIYWKHNPAAGRGVADTFWVTFGKTSKNLQTNLQHNIIKWHWKIKRLSKREKSLFYFESLFFVYEE